MAGQSLLDRLTGFGGDRLAAEWLLIEAIQGQADDRIGTDVIAVTLPNPLVESELTIQYSGVPGEFSGFSPWIIGDGNIAAPANLNNDWQIPFGPWQIVTKGPEPPTRFNGFESTRRKPL